ncbi:MAG: hypothetical protein IJS78_02155 [Clostridia bacterium]|nr:hypothetical protein [Clostridia bacterium]
MNESVNNGRIDVIITKAFSSYQDDYLDSLPPDGELNGKYPISEKELRFFERFQKKTERRKKYGKPLPIIYMRRAAVAVLIAVPVFLAVFVMNAGARTTVKNAAVTDINPDNSAVSDVLNTPPSAETEVTIAFPKVNKSGGAIMATISSEKIPRNLKDLFDKAYAVVLGYVVNDEREETGDSGLTFSYSDVEAEAVIKGELSTGEVICIEETGKRGETADSSIGGVPLLRKNNRVLLFLKRPSGNLNNDLPVYGIVGCYYGKMFLDENDVVYPASYFSKEADNIPDFTEQAALDELLLKLKSE